MKQFVPNRIKHIAKRQLDIVGSALGYEYALTARPTDFTGLTISAPEALRRTGGRPALVDVELPRCRGLKPIAFPCSATGLHPHIVTASAIADGSCQAYRGSPLEAYYSSVTEAVGLDLIGVGDDNFTAKMSCLGPLDVEFPWVSAPGTHVRRQRLTWIKQDAREHGIELAEGAAWIVWGPITPSHGEFEFARLNSLVQSILSGGYSPGNSDATRDHIRGSCVTYGREWAIVVDVGQHRAAVLAALGCENVPVEVRGPAVSESDIATWPGVQSGHFSPNAARKLLIRVVSGAVPNAVTTAWQQSWHAASR